MSPESGLQRLQLLECMEKSGSEAVKRGEESVNSDLEKECWHASPGKLDFIWSNKTKTRVALLLQNVPFKPFWHLNENNDSCVLLKRIHFTRKDSFYHGKALLISKSGLQYSGYRSTGFGTVLRSICTYLCKNLKHF